MGIVVWGETEMEKGLYPQELGNVLVQCVREEMDFCPGGTYRVGTVHSQHVQRAFTRMSLHPRSDTIDELGHHLVGANCGLRAACGVVGGVLMIYQRLE